MRPKGDLSGITSPLPACREDRRIGSRGSHWAGVDGVGWSGTGRGGVGAVAVRLGERGWVWAVCWGGAWGRYADGRRSVRGRTCSSYGVVPTLARSRAPSPYGVVAGLVRGRLGLVRGGPALVVIAIAALLLAASRVSNGAGRLVCGASPLSVRLSASPAAGPGCGSAGLRAADPRAAGLRAAVPRARRRCVRRRSASFSPPSRTPCRSPHMPGAESIRRGSGKSLPPGYPPPAPAAPTRPRRCPRAPRTPGRCPSPRAACHAGPRCGRNPGSRRELC